jgi:hypothetical protein
MEHSYQEAAEKLQPLMDDIVTAFRTQLADQGLDIDKIPKQPMAVEILSFALVNYLTEERLFFSSVEPKIARQEATTIVKAAVIQYRGKNLVPLSRYQIN